MFNCVKCDQPLAGRRALQDHKMDFHPNEDMRVTGLMDEAIDWALAKITVPKTAEEANRMSVEAMQDQVRTERAKTVEVTTKELLLELYQIVTILLVGDGGPTELHKLRIGEILFLLGWQEY